MTYDDVLELCSVALDPDDFVRLVDEVLSMRWSDGTPVVRTDRA